MGATLSVLASVAVLRSTVKEFVPQEIRTYLLDLSRRFSSELIFVIQESHEGSTNHLYKALATYLGSAAVSTPAPPRRVTVGKNESMKGLTYGLDRNSEIVDYFDGIPMRWAYHSETNTAIHFELRWFELRINRKHGELAKSKYIPYILESAKRIRDLSRVVKFYSTKSGRDGWSSKGRNLEHPMSFDTLAMDGDLKRKVIEDLDSFVGARDYYRKIGKVWKRGYLLYGPPGTGKSSLIAAMANYLNFDIYNLNLSVVNSDSSLEHLLLHMSNRSILVVEDIDCSVMLQNREAENRSLTENQNHGTPQLTLSGLLNAIDGLLSCCGDERIVVFTTNYKDRIDPALLRAGRMDMHIHLTYCTFSTFKQLAANYLEIKHHKSFEQVEKLISEVEVSPAEVAGELMKDRDPDTSLNGIITFLQTKKAEAKSKPSPPEEETGGDEIETKTKAEGENGVCNSKVEVGGYRIAEHLASTLGFVILEHGDIAANCTLETRDCRSLFLELVCEMVKKLEGSKEKTLTKAELASMANCVRDLESMKLEVGWLSGRLGEIVPFCNGTVTIP
ncbi:Protein HYPER-SENSITIVITY-RELATED 4 [Linum perenne]